MIIDYLAAVSKRLDFMVRWMVGILLVLMVAVTSAGVISRYGFNNALSWSEELGRYLLVWISFLGACTAAYEDSHIGISILFNRLPAFMRHWTATFTDAMIILFMGAILGGGIQILPLINLRTAPTLCIPMSIPYLIMPLATGIIIFHTLTRMVTRLQRREDI